MVATYDLRAEGWIACPSLDGGRVEMLGLRGVLLQAHQLRGVHDSSPLVTVALYRLLLAILYRCWSASSDEEWDKLWLRLWAEQRFSATEIDAYLNGERCRNCFDLFSPDRPFYQTAELQVVKTEIKKKQQVVIPMPDANLRLANEAPDSNGATLFDHRCYTSLQPWTSAQAARCLVAAQSFGTCTSKTGQARIGDGEILEPPGRNDGLALRGLTIWITGETLFQTLLLNFAPYETWDYVAMDVPAWEQKDGFAQVVSSWNQPQRPYGPAERYTWQGRLIRLIPEQTSEGVVVRKLFYTQGRCVCKTNDAPDDFMKAYNRDEKVGWKALPLNAARAAWRDAHALLSVRSDVFKPPAVLRYVHTLVGENLLHCTTPFGFEAVGLASGGEAAKFLLWRHDRLSVPHTLLKDETLVGLLGVLLADAEFVAAELANKVMTIAKAFVPPHNNPAPKEVKHLADALDARPAYWARLENHFTTLLADLPEKGAVAVPDWRAKVEREAKQALQESCRQLGNTPQAIRAKASVSFYFQADKQTVLLERAEQDKQKKLKKRKGVKASERTSSS